MPTGGGSASRSLTGPITITADDINALLIKSVDGTTFWGFATSGAGEFGGVSPITSGNMMSLNSGGAVFEVRADGTVSARGTNGNSQWLLVTDADATHHINAKTDAGLEVYPSAGDPVTVKNAAGAAIFEVKADGSVHIKTGTSVIADL